MDLESYLRPIRKELVTAAEKVIGSWREKLPDKTQFNRLVSICGEASCAEEIQSYLRYQAARPQSRWKIELVELVIRGSESALAQLARAMGTADERALDRGRVAAWRLYAVYLVRAATYADVSAGARGGHR